MAAHIPAFIQGGSYGDVENSIGPFVAKIDPKTLETRWYTQLRNTVEANEWDYPGAMAIESDGFIYVVSGYRLYKVHPEDGSLHPPGRGRLRSSSAFACSSAHLAHSAFSFRYISRLMYRGLRRRIAGSSTGEKI
jgi:hypothetical protein